MKCMLARRGEIPFTASGATRGAAGGTTGGTTGGAAGRATRGTGFIDNLGKVSSKSVYCRRIGFTDFDAPLIRVRVACRRKSKL